MCACTGPLLRETLDVQNIPLRQSRDLSVNLCGKDMPCVSYNGGIACKIIESKLKSTVDFSGSLTSQINLRSMPDTYSF